MTHPAKKIVAIVPAAGVGKRMKTSIPKQYIELQGKTVLAHSVAKLDAVEQISTICVAISADDEYFNQAQVQARHLMTTEGGQERADSVLNALNALTELAPDWVLVHDAARPMVSSDDIEHLIEHCLALNEGGILAAKVRDTIKQGEQKVTATIPREQLFHALTPQLFAYQELKQALTDALAQGVTITDEASAMEWAGYPVNLVAGRNDNFKITTPEDLQLANFLLAQQTTEFS